MKEQLLTLARRAWNDFRAFSPGQKAVTVAAAAALIVGGVVFATWKSPVQYAPLYTNLAASDASAIVDKLNAEKIPYKLSGAGTEILVPQDKVYETRLTMSGAGLPGSSQTGYSLLDKEGVTTSEFKQQVDYQRAIEGELVKTIQSISGVQSASVHLAIPQQDVFNDGTQKPTAAVMVSTANGTQLTAQQVQSIVYLVSSSVPNMSADSVTVTDSSGHVLAAAGSGLTAQAGTDTRTQATEDYNNRLSSSLQNMINQVVGAGHAVVTVNSELDFDKTNTEKKTYVYDRNAPPLSSQTTNERYTGNQAGNGGTLGAGTPATGTTAGTNGAGTYTKNSATVDNALGTVTETTQNAPGAVKKLAIAVLLDGSVPNVNQTAIQSLVSSAVGLDTNRGDTLAIQAMPFDTTASQQAAAASAAAAKAAAAKAAHDRMMGYIRQGVLALIVLAIVLGTVLAGRRRRPAEPEPVFADDGFFDDQPVVELVAPAPPPDEVAHLAAVAEMQEAAARRRALVALADEQPSDVARVLSGWLNSREN